ncbi:TRAP transporter substrate-binding protein [Pseudorhizobium pelagicum]|uniref:ABC transporter substrate-binding protein n=1 Tax=Pseudorhizobium pelagicum TaxID=1509405 RepID=A0A922T7H1_9HYPH|nr:TRAP transporter substrate-binding protein [Pseudorhizobium pelagicum]KEQ04534.1 ABC transporter substrate-binding protein [Pseudorhizobium pelagicum]KEQ06694.1 ABC transporter substrate-binding protein [Pseudorhizobium pelagicum]
MKIMKIFAAAVLTAGAFVSAAQAETFKFANYMAPTHPYVASTFDPFAKAVEEGTKGEVKVTVYNGGEMGAGPAEQYARAVDGVAEFSISLPGYTASTFPLTLAAELPGVLDEKTGTETIWKNIELFQPEYRRVKLVALWSSAENIIYSATKPIRSIDDVKGMKIRVPSRNSGELVSAWGGTPVSMPVSDVYNALQTGVIDAAMIDGTATKAFRLGEVAKFVTLGMETTNSPFFIVMNRDAWDSLNDEQKAVVEEAGKQASMNGQASQLRVAADGIETFAQMEGREVIRLTPEEAAPFNQAAEEVTARIVDEIGGDAEAIVEALKAN